MRRMVVNMNTVDKIIMYQDFLEVLQEDKVVDISILEEVHRQMFFEYLISKNIGFVVSDKYTVKLLY